MRTRGRLATPGIGADTGSICRLRRISRSSLMRRAFWATARFIVSFSPTKQPQRRATDKPIAANPCPVIFAIGISRSSFLLAIVQSAYQSLRGLFSTGFNPANCDGPPQANPACGTLPHGNPCTNDIQSLHTIGRAKGAERGPPGGLMTPQAAEVLSVTDGAGGLIQLHFARSVVAQKSRYVIGGVEGSRGRVAFFAADRK